LVGLVGRGSIGASSSVSESRGMVGFLGRGRRGASSSESEKYDIVGEGGLGVGVGASGIAVGRGFLAASNSCALSARAFANTGQVGQGVAHLWALGGLGGALGSTTFFSRRGYTVEGLSSPQAASLSSRV